MCRRSALRPRMRLRATVTRRMSPSACSNAGSETFFPLPRTHVYAGETSQRQCPGYCLDRAAASLFQHGRQAAHVRAQASCSPVMQHFMANGMQHIARHCG